VSSPAERSEGKGTHLRRVCGAKNLLARGRAPDGFPSPRGILPLGRE